MATGENGDIIKVNHFQRKGFKKQLTNCDQDVVTSSAEHMVMIL